MNETSLSSYQNTQGDYNFDHYQDVQDKFPEAVTKELLSPEEYAKYQLAKKANDLKEAKLSETLKNMSLTDAIHQENQAEDRKIETEQDGSNFEHLSRREDPAHRSKQPSSDLQQSALNDSQVFGDAADQRTFDRPAKDLVGQKAPEEPIQCKGFTISDAHLPSEYDSEAEEEEQELSHQSNHDEQQIQRKEKTSKPNNRPRLTDLGNELDEEVKQINQSDRIMDSSAASAWESNVGSGISIDSEEMQPQPKKISTNEKYPDREADLETRAKLERLIKLEHIYDNQNDYASPEPKNETKT